jgi:hypothetical protein
VTVSAKDLRLAPIKSSIATAFVKRNHYSGKVAANSQLHIGVFLDDRLEGVLQFGPALDKSKIVGLVKDTPWNGFLELNRMVFTERLPRNSESRAIAQACRLLRKMAPHVQWVISFADATQCGDGTIYRASGFVLTAMNPSKNIARLPDGSTIHKMSLEANPTNPRPELGGRTYYDITGGRYNFAAYCQAAGAVVLPGFQMRYIKFLDPTAASRLSVPTIPFSEIERRGASMYLGQKRSSNSQPCAGSADGGTADIPVSKGRFDPDLRAPTSAAGEEL